VTGDGRARRLDGLVLRELTAADAAFQAEMLYTAAFWRPDGEHPPIEIVLARPEARRYLDGWGRDGDLGIVAELDGEPVGAAWCRLFTEEDHGDGYVDDETPELAIAVRDGARGLGVGRRLLVALHERARANGVERMALSSEQDNFARTLYASVGYVELAPDDPKDRMILDLG
jgi:GNAT superfamily N-acetyltransferase